MKISVVILNWNRPQDTIAAVQSTLKQDYPDFEVVIWDNASSDNSLTLLKSHFHSDPRVRLLVGAANYGVAGGRNRAFPASKGDVIFSLDSDAIFESPDALSKMAARLKNESTIGAISFEVKRPDGHLMWPFSRPASEWRQKEFETIRVDGCAFATPREVFVKSGGFAEHFSPYGAEDQHYAFKLIGLGYKVLYFPSVVVIHAFSPKGRTGLQFRMHVRNMLWTGMELFPFRHVFWATSKIAARLFMDARQQRQIHDFYNGLSLAISDFSWSRRSPMPRVAWKYFRGMVAEDKRLARSA